MNTTGWIWGEHVKLGPPFLVVTHKNMHWCPWDRITAIVSQYLDWIWLCLVPIPHSADVLVSMWYGRITDTTDQTGIVHLHWNYVINFWCGTRDVKLNPPHTVLPVDTTSCCYDSIHVSQCICD